MNRFNRSPACLGALRSHPLRHLDAGIQCRAYPGHTAAEGIVHLQRDRELPIALVLRGIGTQPPPTYPWRGKLLDLL